MEWVKRGLNRWFKWERHDTRADPSRNPVANAADDRPPPRVESSVGRVVIMDLRTEEEQQLQAAVQAGVPLGADLDARVEELLEIAASRELLRDERVVAIGRELDEEGGKGLM